MVGGVQIDSAGGEAISRARVLRLHGTYGFSPGDDLVALVDVAGRSLGTPIALVTIIDGTDLHMVAGQGFDEPQVLQFEALSLTAQRAEAAMIIEDVAAARGREAGELAGALDLGAFAAMPIRRRQADGASGQIIGGLCVAAPGPRPFSPGDRAMLADFVRLIEAVVDARRAAAEALAVADQRGQRGRELRRASRQFRQAERMANMGSWRYSIADQVVEFSEQTLAIYGVSAAEKPSLGEALDFYPPAARATMTASLAHTIETGEPFDVELDFLNAQGRELRVRVMGEVELAGGIPVAVIGVFQDITQRHRMEEQLRRSAHTDELTGIANRAAFVRELGMRIAQSRADGTPLALLLLDLDGYKGINDTYGHVAGDEVLRVVAGRLLAIGCASAFTARLGGDELALIVSGGDCVGLEGRTARLLTAIARPVAFEAKSIRVSATIGIAAFTADVTAVRELVQRADMALYEAKRRERGTARVFGADTIVRPARERRSAA